MLDHFSFDVSDIARSTAFYKAALAPLGYVMLRQTDTHASFGILSGPNKSRDPGGDFWLAQGTPAPNAMHFAFIAESHDAVRAFYAAAMAAGGRDNGAPGLRPNYHANYYAAFVHDPDGYNIEAVCHAAK